MDKHVRTAHKQSFKRAGSVSSFPPPWKKAHLKSKTNENINESINIENANNFLLDDKVKLKPKDQQVEEMEIDTNNDLNSEHKECSDQIDLLQAKIKQLEECLSTVPNDIP